MKDALLWGDLLSTVLVRRFFSGVFFVYCGSIFDKRFMRYSSVSSPISVPRETRSTDFEREHNPTFTHLGAKSPLSSNKPILSKRQF